MKEKERSGHKKGPMTRWEEQGLKEGNKENFQDIHSQVTSFFTRCFAHPEIKH